eukprot:TRINITY_DN70855_c0_g1_i1.p2 TRINITY_DN70855_c0_g1~~TRINITY_DN70855_c0_g1_i1.p2  ORF type:complete len:116 (+),score=5.01 TRINITY_DN70855_c0_g1_i1:175-522(+)
MVLHSMLNLKLELPQLHRLLVSVSETWMVCPSLRSQLFDPACLNHKPQTTKYRRKSRRVMQRLPVLPVAQTRRGAHAEDDAMLLRSTGTTRMCHVASLSKRSSQPTYILGHRSVQ